MRYTNQGAFIDLVCDSSAQAANVFNISRQFTLRMEMKNPFYPVAPRSTAMRFMNTPELLNFALELGENGLGAPGFLEDMMQQYAQSTAPAAHQ